MKGLTHREALLDSLCSDERVGAGQLERAQESFQ